MKLSQDIYKKLDQGDRIEYLLREQEITKKYEGSVVFELGKYFMFIFFIILLMTAPFVANQTDKNLEVVKSLFGILFLMIKVAIVVEIVALALDILINLYQNKKIKELQDEFFRVEVKNVKRH